MAQPLRRAIITRQARFVRGKERTVPILQPPVRNTKEIVLDVEPDAGPAKVVPGRRRTLGRVLLLLAVVAALAVGAWGLLSSTATPARLGEAAGVSGGTLRVEKVTPEHMAAMQSDKFAASGMSMSSTGMDMAPKGQRRFTVDVTLSAGSGDLSYTAEQFRLSGEGLEATGPIRQELEDGSVPAGSSVSGNLVFQAPEGARGLMLSFDGGQPVALDLPPVPEDSHSEGDHSGAGAQPENDAQPPKQADGHDHEH